MRGSRAQCCYHVSVFFAYKIDMRRTCVAGSYAVCFESVYTSIWAAAVTGTCSTAWICVHALAHVKNRKHFPCRRDRDVDTVREEVVVYWQWP
jgi:hypothetical protein